jgi:hypothetical protein
MSKHRAPSHREVRCHDDLPIHQQDMPRIKVR